MVGLNLKYSNTIIKFDWKYNENNLMRSSIQSRGIFSSECTPHLLRQKYSLKYEYKLLAARCVNCGLW